MNRLLIAQDKANHIVYGAMLASVTLVVALLLGSAYSVSIASAVVSLFAIGKEVYDRLLGKGTPEAADALVTLAGGWLVILPYFVSTRL